MLAVARRLRPQIDWRQGDATQLPFADASYDVVMSQFALMYFPDRTAALTEMVRVLRPGGRLVIAVWGPLRACDGLRDRDGDHAASVWTSSGGCPHGAVRLGRRGHVARSLQGSWHQRGGIELREGTMTFPTIEVFVETEVKGSPLEALLEEESYRGLMREAQEKLRRFRADGGDVIMPMDAFIITAAKS